MSGQIMDTVIYRRKHYELVGIEGGDPFDPRDHGMEPEMLHTACYRGFHATFAVVRDRLLLRDLIIRARAGHYPPLNGAKPMVETYEATYRKILLPLPFTGVLRLGRDFSNELYVHMGYQDATAYGTVLDLPFNQGCVTAVEDLSEALKKERGEFKERYEAGDMITGMNQSFDISLGS